jgi:hypothetical protein
VPKSNWNNGHGYVEWEELIQLPPLTEKLDLKSTAKIPLSLGKDPQIKKRTRP